MAREGLMDDCGYNFDVDEDSYNSGFKDGFLTAIDEFVAEMFEIADGNRNGNMFVWCSDIKEIAEQLKGE